MNVIKWDSKIRFQEDNYLKFCVKMKDLFIHYVSETALSIVDGMQQLTEWILAVLHSLQGWIVFLPESKAILFISDQKSAFILFPFLYLVIHYFGCVISSSEMILTSLFLQLSRFWCSGIAPMQLRLVNNWKLQEYWRL